MGKKKSSNRANKKGKQTGKKVEKCHQCLKVVESHKVVCLKCHHAIYCNEGCQELHRIKHNSTCFNGCHLRKTADGTVGVFASKEYERGDDIFSERPMMLSGVGGMDIIENFTMLDPETKARFVKLPNNFPHRGIEGIFNTNDIRIGHAQDQSAVFETFCKLRHSCCCNVNIATIYPEGEVRELLKATKNISIGEELRPSKIAGCTMSRAERRAKIKEVFGYICKCPVCSLTGKAQAFSDRNRRQIARLHVQSETCFRRGEYEETVEAAKKKLELFVLEGEDYPRNMYLTQRLILISLVRMGNLEEASFYAKQAYFSACEDEGPIALLLF